MRWLKAFARSSLRPLIVGIACCCFTFLALHTYYSPSTLRTPDGNPAAAINFALRMSNHHENGDADLRRSFGNLRRGGKYVGMQELDGEGSDNLLPDRDVNYDEADRDFSVNENSDRLPAYRSSTGNESKLRPPSKDAESRQNPSVYTKMGRKRHIFKRSRYDPIPRWTNILYYIQSNIPNLFQLWNRNREDFCEERFIVYTHDFAHLRDVTMDRENCLCTLKGGEFIENVLRQTEELEYYKFEMGCFRLGCRNMGSRPSYYFNSNNHLNDWLFSLSFHPLEESLGEVRKTPVVQPQFTIAVTRYEYANLYHTMTDWYNAFLMMQYFNHTPSTTNILIIDAHPFGQLDSTWSQLFNSTRRLSALPSLSLFPNLVWSILGYNSPMTSYITSAVPPLYEEFREFFLSSYALDVSAHKLDCSNLSVLFIWRRDYVAHPRNPTGTISRKISNEVQLVNAVRRSNPTFKVTGVQIDLLPFREQLEMITSTDVLIGMHGAGLTHAVFLPRSSALIELVPGYWTASTEHFESIAMWRGLIYEKWVNNDPLRDIDAKLTMVPPNVVNALLRKVSRRLCISRYSAEDLDLAMYGGNQSAGEGLSERNSVDEISHSRNETVLSDNTDSRVQYTTVRDLYSQQNVSNLNEYHRTTATQTTLKNTHVTRSRVKRITTSKYDDRFKDQINDTDTYFSKSIERFKDQLNDTIASLRSSVRLNVNQSMPRKKKLRTRPVLERIATKRNQSSEFAGVKSYISSQTGSPPKRPSFHKTLNILTTSVIQGNATAKRRKTMRRYRSANMTSLSSSAPSAEINYQNSYKQQQNVTRKRLRANKRLKDT